MAGQTACVPLPGGDLEKQGSCSHIDISPRLDGGNLGVGGIWDGKIWHSKSVPIYATIFEGPNNSKHPEAGRTIQQPSRSQEQRNNSNQLKSQRK